jgi:hypothetical protein
MKKYGIITVIILMVLSVLLLVFVKIRKDALHGRALKKITVKVLDKTGSPIQDAQVGITFRTYTV